MIFLLILLVISPVFAIEAPPTTSPIPPEKLWMPPKQYENSAHIVVKINDYGSAAILSNYELTNRKNESMKELVLLIPYDAVKVYYARQQKYETYAYEVYVDTKGRTYGIAEFEDAKAKAGYADNSGIDAEEKAVHGLVYAGIKYPNNATKFELVNAKEFKKTALEYGGWEKVPANLQHALVISVRKETKIERKYVDRDIPFEAESKNATLLKLNLPSEVKPEESTKLIVKYKVESKITSDGLRATNFAIMLALPYNTFDAVVTIMPPKHEIFKFTKPECELITVKTPSKEAIGVETYAPPATPAPIAPRALEQKVEKQREAESKMLGEEGSYFTQGKAYRLMLFDITPDEKFEIAGWYSDKEKYYGVPAGITALLSSMLLMLGWRKIKALVW